MKSIRRLQYKKCQNKTKVSKLLKKKKEIKTVKKVYNVQKTLMLNKF